MSDQTLQSWIDTATTGLPPSAVAKFSAEIADHFAEARRKHAGLGLPPDEAERAALAGLGDAHAVARTLREAHFSRRAYARGETALLLVFGAFAASMALTLLSWQLGPAESPALAETWITPVYLVISFASVFCFLFGMRSALTLLREQFDIRSPRWGWRLFAGFYLAGAIASTLMQALTWINGIGGGVEIDTPSMLFVTWGQASNLLSTLNQLGMIGAGALLAAFCFGRWWPRRREAGLTLAALLVMGMISGAALAADNVMWLAVSRDLSLSPAANRLAPYIAVIYLVPYFWLQVALARLFGRMRHPGAVLAR